jgi:hypothetical protein
MVHLLPLEDMELLPVAVQMGHMRGPGTNIAGANAANNFGGGGGGGESTPTSVFGSGGSGVIILKWA